MKTRNFLRLCSVHRNHPVHPIHLQPHGTNLSYWANSPGRDSLFGQLGFVRAKGVADEWQWKAENGRDEQLP